MNATNRLLATAACLVLARLSFSQAPAGAPAGATGLCKDGTYYTGATKQGACKGHKGVQDWYATASPATPPSKTAASAPLQSAAPAASAAAPANATGLCNDGTYYTGSNKQGACRGHKGVRDWYANQPPVAASSKTPIPPTTAAPVQPSAPAAYAKPPAGQPTAPLTQAAPGGGAGQVWLNTSSNVYHCEGSRYYGKTKVGAYMTEAAAKAKGARADHGKECGAR